MSTKENKELVTRIVEDFINKNQPSVADELFAEDFINHSPQFGVAPNLEGLKQMISLFHKGFPDLHLNIEDMIAEDDKVVIRVRSTGTHTGEFMGLKISNRRIDSTQISIIRIEGGKVKERWNVFNQLETMRQLGLM